jgi:hypothetical protein
LLENAAGRCIVTNTWLLKGSQASLTLEVLQGDLGLHRFGLDETTWKRMTDEVDIILANGSLVSGILFILVTIYAKLLASSATIHRLILLWITHPSSQPTSVVA